MRNYYDILGVSRNASRDEIKAAYRRLAKMYHPDTGSESEEVKERFQEIQEAYAVLSDPEKRKMYHYYGHEAYRKSYYAQHSSGFWGSGAHTGEEGNGPGHDGGGTHENGHCGSCQNGAHSHGTDGHCGACDEGRKPAPEEGPPPQAIRIAVWLDLKDTLYTVVKDTYYTERQPNTNTSSAAKFKEKNWKFQVKIPAGAYDHQFFLLEDVICGDTEFVSVQKERNPDKLFVIIVLLRDKPGFVRQGYHLYTDCIVDYHTLVLGGTVKVPALDGEVLMDIPAGTAPEQKLRLINQGLVRPKKMGGRGDLYVKLHIRIPQELTEEQRKAVEKLKDVFSLEYS